MSGFDIAGGLKNLLPGPLDSVRGPYATVAAANLAIPNTIVGGESYRKGKFVEIGSSAPYVTYWWSGTDYADDKLVEYFGGLIKKTDTNTSPIIFSSYIINNKSINSAGNLGNNTGFKIIDGLPIVVGNTYSVGGFIGAANKYLAFVNSSGVVVGSVTILSALPVSVVAPPTAVTIRFTIKNSAESDDSGWINTAYVLNTAIYPGDGITTLLGKKLIASYLSSETISPDPISPGNPINKKYFETNGLTTVDMVTSPSVNLAQTRYKRDGLFIASDGKKYLGAGWRLFRIPVVAGDIITFGRFAITGGGYSSFWDNTEVDGAAGAVGLLLYNGDHTGTTPKTVTAPAGSAWLILDAKRPADPDSNSVQITINRGGTLIDYVSPNDTLKSIKGADIPTVGSSNVTKFSDLTDVPPYLGNAGKALKVKPTEDGLQAFTPVEQGGNVSFSTLYASSLQIDLPEGAGSPPAGVLVGDMWLDTTTGNIKVRMT